MSPRTMSIGNGFSCGVEARLRNDETGKGRVRYLGESACGASQQLCLTFVQQRGATTQAKEGSPSIGRGLPGDCQFGL